jgi:hypothetical protein
MRIVDFWAVYDRNKRFMEKEMTCHIDKDAPSEIRFTANPEKGWAIKITKEGIRFNREAYPDSSADDFANAFMETLEKNFNVRFEKKDKE